MIKLEIAKVKYTKSGEYDYTIESDWKTFETDEQARKYVMESLTPPADKTWGYEYYFYKDGEEDCYECIVEKDYFNRYTADVGYFTSFKKYTHSLIGNFKSIEEAKEKIEEYIEEEKEYIDDGETYDFKIYDNKEDKIAYERHINS